MNPEQREAVEHFEGPILVLAGAGSGKTRVLTTRIAHLIHEHGVDPSAILAVTFTNKAAGEMRERVRQLLGSEPGGMWIGTFHSIGARLLRRHAPMLGWDRNFTIYDADNALAEVKRTMDRLRISEKKWHPKAVRGAISDAKNRLIDPVEYEKLAADAFSQVVADVFPAYQAALKDQNAFDFDDLLVKPVELFRDFPAILARYGDRFQFILVDEYQDTNHAQYRLIEMLSAPEASATGANLMVVGDDDQSIYGWRGADVSNILDFETRFPGTRLIRLEQNYRSTQRILDAANRVIAENVRRKGKTLRTDADTGELLTVVESSDERDEADWIASEMEVRMGDDPQLGPRDFVILYRTNAQSRALEEALRRRDLPYQIIGGTRFYERREIMDVLAYLRIISNPRDAQAFERIVNYPRRGIGKVSQERILAFAAREGITPLDAARRAAEARDVPTAAQKSLEQLAAAIDGFRRRAPHQGAGELLEQLLADFGIFAALAEEGPEGEDRAENVRELLAGAFDFDDQLEELLIDEEFDLAEAEAFGPGQSEGPADAEGPAEGSRSKSTGVDGDVAVNGELFARAAPPAAPDNEYDYDDEAPAARPTALDLFLQKVSLITDIDRHDPEANAVSLMTLHTAKGLEFPVVFLSGLEDGLFPLARVFDEPGELEEERRLFYVGITRAERKVYLTHARTRRRAGEVKACVPSSFLEPLPDELVEERATPQLERQKRQYDSWRDQRSSFGGGRYGSAGFGSAGFGSGGGRRRGAKGGRVGKEHETDAFGNEAGDYVIDYSESQDAPRFIKGEVVRHPQFGRGTIKELSGFGRDLKAVIDFDDIGRKKVVVRYANLQKEY